MCERTSRGREGIWDWEWDWDWGPLPSMTGQMDTQATGREMSSRPADSAYVGTTRPE
jgi:hypothetical protein